MITFIEKIEAVLKEFDDAELNSIIESIPARRKAVRAYQDTKPFGGWDYQKMFSLCGGKGWYELLRCYGNNGLFEVLTKNHEKKTSERNAKIAKKLADSGVKEIIDGVEQYKQGGFEGTWFFQTDAGQKRIEIQVIVAGGDIQCLHNRVLVKIK
jgi:imidazole glycerol phosphate synthase subunit HisF